MFTKEEMKKLEKQSIENMLVYYEEEMRLVVSEDLSPSSFLTKPLIRRLTDSGILERKWGRKNCKVTLSKKGREWYNIHSEHLT